MERAFRVSKDVGYGKALQRYCDVGKDRYEKIINFFKLHNIQTTQFHVEGNGSCNYPFNENEKNEIKLAIIPTQEDKHLLKGTLLDRDYTLLAKEYIGGLRFLRRNSKLMKEFQQYCVDEEVVINHDEPLLWDYFKNLDFEEYTSSKFGLDDVFYLKLNCNTLTESDIPEGMIPIKLSEYHLKLEEFQAKRRCNNEKDR